MNYLFAVSLSAFLLSNISLVAEQAATKEAGKASEMSSDKKMKKGCECTSADCSCSMMPSDDEGEAQDQTEQDNAQ